ncbi:ATP-binding cassette domain-containing protein [Christensenellaceae bacterium OttesenSCG-928-M15]|nr:ATP-binding cassette domain-containing protein [Christensenellaceae bacterium OttesenSCG-928-M15]
MSAPILEVKNLKKHFKVNKGLLHAVDDVSFTINEGETIGVVGESGCGKSTLGRSILRLVEPTGGDVVFKGQDVTKLNKKQMRRMRQEMQIIFQDPYSSLDPRLSVSDLIAEPLLLNGLCKSKSDAMEKVKKYMDMAGIAARLVNTYPHELDGGRRQRIGIARALILEPSFIVCDEPVSALDVSIQAQILNLLQDLQKEMKLTYMFITHDLSVVKHISTSIMVMYLGKVAEKAPTSMLFDHPSHPYTRALLSAIPVPDYALRNAPMETMRGEVGSPINPKPGCRFASRCDFCAEPCKNADPPLEEIEPMHFVSCVKKKEEGGTL